MPVQKQSAQDLNSTVINSDELAIHGSSRETGGYRDATSGTGLLKDKRVFLNTLNRLS